MKDNKKGKRKYILIMLTGIVLAGLLTSKIVLNKLKIEEPIYFRYLVQHYLPTIADSVTATCTMQLIYVQDFTDQREIKEVEFVDHPELSVTAIGRNERKYGVYKVVDETLYMEWNSSEMSDVSNAADIHSIQVTYSDGTCKTVDIGKIYIYGGESDREVLEAVDCIPLFESEREQTYQANERIRLEGLTPMSKEFLETTDIIQSYSLQVGEDDITDTGCELKKGQKVVFRMSLNGFDVEHFADANCEYDYLQIVPQLIYYNESGKVYSQDIYNFPIWSTFENYRDVREYVKKRTSSDK